MAKDDIPLHPTRGLDPHMTVCPVCNEHTSEIVLGHVFKATARDGTLHYCAFGKIRQHEKTINEVLQWKEVEENEAMLSSFPCDKCAKHLQSGAILFTCDCGKSGMLLMSDHTEELIEKLREEAGVPHPKPLGISLSKKHMEHCTICAAFSDEEIPRMS